MDARDAVREGGLVILMRHGDYSVTADGRKGLNAAGIAAAERSARFVRDELGITDVAALFSSDAERACETAEIMGRHVKHEERIQDAALRPGGSGIAELVFRDYCRKRVIIVTHIPVIETQYASFLGRNAFFEFRPASLTVLKYIPGKLCYEQIASFPV